MKLIRQVVTPVLMFALTGVATWAAAQTRTPDSATYPSKPIKLIVPFAPGGTTDKLARLLATELSTKLGGNPVIVENKAGASTIIGTAFVAQSAPDGYTLILSTNTGISSNPLLFKKLPYQVDQLRPVALFSLTPVILSVNPANPANSVADLVKDSKLKNGGLSAATLGKGSSVHLITELISLRTGMQITPIPYNGSGPALLAIVGGNVDLYSDSVPTSIPLINAGKIKPIAISSKQRSPLYPNLPTFEEAGIKDGTIHTWFGVMAPSKTPDAVVTALNKAINEILAIPTIRTQLETEGSIVRPTSPQGFQEFIDAETKTWAAVIQATQIQLD